MRPIRTPLEQAALDLLRDQLVDAGHQVAEDPRITDSPDALFLVDSCPIAVECRAITPEHVLKLHGVQFAAEELYYFAVPVEPHIWVQKAINSKNPKVSKYRSRTNAAHISLLLHSSFAMDRYTFEAQQNFYLRALSHGVATCSSLFDSVIFADLKSSKVICLSNCVLPMKLETRPVEQIRLLKLPVAEFWLCRYDDDPRAIPDSNGMVERTTPPFPLICPADHSFELQPLDKSFRVDYLGYRAAVASGKFGRSPPGPVAEPSN